MTTLGYVLLAVVAAVWLLARLGRQLGALAGGIGPVSITLEAAAAEPPRELLLRARLFEAEGFRRIGAFSLREMPVTLVALLHEAERAYAVVYQHPQSGVWSDVCTFYADGGSLTVSNAPRGGELDQRPAHVKVHDASVDERRLVAMTRSSRAVGAPLRQLGAADFASDFERAYREEMEWRMGRGGATHDEIRRVAQATGQCCDASTIAKAREIIAKDAAKKLARRA